MRRELKLLARTRRFIQQSGQLVTQSEKLMAAWQRLIDDYMAGKFKRISARLKRKGPHSGSMRLR
jgi:hypothetical protein